MVTFGWGDLPDQHGRRWDDDDGESPLPPAPAQRDPMSWFELLQHADDGLLVALAANHPDARRLAEGVVRGLDLRRWEGDAELAELLRARAWVWPRN